MRGKKDIGGKDKEGCEEEEKETGGFCCSEGRVRDDVRGARNTEGKCREGSEEEKNGNRKEEEKGHEGKEEGKMRETFIREREVEE